MTSRTWTRGLAVALLAAMTCGSALGLAPLKTVDGSALKKALKASKGKVVVINFWATWCPPCKEELPSLVKLHKAYAKRGVQVILVSVDDPDQRKEAQAFLQKLGASTTNLIAVAGKSEATVRAVFPDWPGALPATIVYTKSGKVAQQIIGMRTYAQFEAAVKQAQSAKG